jgi:hypothetical protein
MRNVLLRTYTVSGEQRIAEWPMDVEEPFCDAPPGEQNGGSRLVINPDSQNCNPHWPDPEGRPCLIGYRTPPECQHDPMRLDPNHPRPGELRCLECGLIGRDATADWRDRLRGTASPLVSDRGGSEVIALGDAGVTDPRMTDG